MVACGRRLASGGALSLGVAVGLFVWMAAWGGAQDQLPSSVETVLQGLEQRPNLVESATGVWTLEVFPSPRHLTEAEAEQDERFVGLGSDKVASLDPRDMVVLRFSYDAKRTAWQACPLTDSGWNWWGIGGRYTLELWDDLRASDFLSAGYADGESIYWYGLGMASDCLVEEFNPFRIPEALRLFKSVVVANMTALVSLDRLRAFYSLEDVGTTAIGDEPCRVIAGVAPRENPIEHRRLWVAPEKGFAVLRAEWVQLNPDTREPAMSNLVTASGLHEYGAGIWLPDEVRVHNWYRNYEEPMGWQWTKRFRVSELAVNEGFKWEPQDWLFPITKRWIDDRQAGEDRLLWDSLGVRGELENLPPVIEDPFGKAVLENADVLQAWMTRPAGAEEP
jgi:hypothetical protein